MKRGREGETERGRKVVEEGVGGLGRINTFLKVSTDDSNDISPSALSVALSTSFHTLPSSRCPILPCCSYPPVLLLLLSGPLPIPSKLGFLPPPLPLLGGEKRLVTLQTPWHGGGDATSSLPQQSETDPRQSSGRSDQIRVPRVQSSEHGSESMHNGSFENLKKFLAGIPTALREEETLAWPPAASRSRSILTAERAQPCGQPAVFWPAGREVYSFSDRQRIGSWGRAENINR